MASVDTTTSGSIAPAPAPVPSIAMDDDDDVNKKKDHQEEPPPPPHVAEEQQQQQQQPPTTTVGVGSHVKIHGLVNASQHNGKIGVVVKSAPSAPASAGSSGVGGGAGVGITRVGVKLQDGSGKVLAVKLDNLTTVVNADASSPAEANKQQKNTSTITRTQRTNPKKEEVVVEAQPPKQRELKRQYGLLQEFDGSFDVDDPNTLVLYYHFRDQAFDCYNASEYQSQLVRYLDHDMFVRLVLPRQMHHVHRYWLVGLQHNDSSKNVLCDVAFQAGRSFTGISMLMKHKCFHCGNPRHDEVELCQGCFTACFCKRCQQSKPSTLTDHQRFVCNRIDTSNITIETECIQLLE